MPDTEVDPRFPLEDAMPTSAAETHKKGQVVQIARGKLQARLLDKPLAKGELFLQTDATPYTPGATEIYDIVTQSYVRKIFQGDLFAGNNSSKQVYVIGSGSSLKWGGVLFDKTSFEDIEEEIKKYPNFIFLYNGASTIKLYTADDQRDSYKNAVGQGQPNTVDRPFVAGEDSQGHPNYSEWYNSINPGDLVFYSAALDQVVVLPMGRSSDALTKINVEALVSNSMRLLLDEGDGETKAATLKTFLDGPARHYQYLTEEFGWNPVEISVLCEITRDEETNEVTVTPGVVTLNEDGDGYIHYIPFAETNKGRNVYNISKIAPELANVTLHEGDLILSVPRSDGRVDHKVVSLYSALFQELQLKFNGRADQYATDIWKDGIPDAYTGDDDYFTLHDNLQAFIDRLFLTKVDIDPTTHKIISSQLPDFLLGAPKYQGHFTAALEDWENVTSETTVTNFVLNVLLARDRHPNWENLDKSEDATDAGATDAANQVSGSDAVNEKLKSGCYWIYQGESVDISDYTSLFHLDSDPDDFNAANAEEKRRLSEIQERLANETDEDVITQLNAERDKLIEIITKHATHMLNKGDWVIYNGETQRFEIIDNSSSFIGILVDGVKVASVVNFLHPLRDPEKLSRYVDGDSVTNTVQAKETHIEADSTTITFTNPAAVLFKDENLDALTHQNFIPVITAKGYALDSRLELIDDETGVKVSFGSSSYAEYGLYATSFRWFAPEDSNPETREYFFDDIVVRDPNVDGVEVTVKTTRIKDSTKSGLNFEEFRHLPDLEDPYKFSIDLEKEPNLSLPQYSGILTTEEYVNQGFTVIKAIIDDLYEEVISDSTKGHIEWLQTVRNKLDEDGNQVYDKDNEPVKEIFDSKVREVYDASHSLALNLFYDSHAVEPSYDENLSNNFSTLSVYAKLTEAQLFKFSSDPYAPLDYELGAADGTVVEVLNPSERPTARPVENVLPNHSGIILNNNSVIDGGEWN